MDEKGSPIAFDLQGGETCTHMWLVLDQLSAMTRISLDDPYCPVFVICKACGCAVALREEI